MKNRDHDVLVLISPGCSILTWIDPNYEEQSWFEWNTKIQVISNLMLRLTSFFSRNDHRFLPLCGNSSSNLRWWMHEAHPKRGQTQGRGYCPQEKGRRRSLPFRFAAWDGAAPWGLLSVGWPVLTWKIFVLWPPKFSKCQICYLFYFLHGILNQ